MEIPILVRSLKSSILSSTSFQMDKNPLGSGEGCCRTIKVQSQHGCSGSRAPDGDPRVPPNPPKKEHANFNEYLFDNSHLLWWPCCSPFLRNATPPRAFPSWKKSWHSPPRFGCRPTRDVGKEKIDSSCDFSEGHGAEFQHPKNEAVLPGKKVKGKKEKDPVLTGKNFLIDRTPPNFRGSNSVDHPIICTSEKSFQGF